MLKNRNFLNNVPFINYFVIKRNNEFQKLNIEMQRIFRIILDLM